MPVHGMEGRSSRSRSRCCSPPPPPPPPWRCLSRPRRFLPLPWRCCWPPCCCADPAAGGRRRWRACRRAAPRAPGRRACRRAARRSSQPRRAARRSRAARHRRACRPRRGWPRPASPPAAQRRPACRRRRRRRRPSGGLVRGRRGLGPAGPGLGGRLHRGRLVCGRRLDGGGRSDGGLHGRLAGNGDLVCLFSAHGLPGLLASCVRRGTQSRWGDAVRVKVDVRWKKESVRAPLPSMSYRARDSQ